MRVVCIKEFRHEYLDAKPNKIFEILPIRGHSPFEFGQICIKTEYGGFWVSQEFFLPLSEFRKQKINKIIHEN